jgi:hypothetical protein
MSTPGADDPTAVTGEVPDREPSRLGRLSAQYGRSLVTALILVTVVFLIGPVLVTFIASFFENWTGILPSGGLTLRNWAQALGIAETVGASRGLGGFWTFIAPDVLFVVELPSPAEADAVFPV